MSTHDGDNPNNPAAGLRNLSRQMGTPAVDLAAVTLPLAVLEHLSEDVARRLRVLPLRVDKTHLFIATSSPNEQRALDELAFLTGRRIVAYAAPDALVSQAIIEAYAAKRRGELEWRGARSAQGGSATQAPAFHDAEDLLSGLVAEGPTGPVPRRTPSGGVTPLQGPFAGELSYAGSHPLTNPASRSRPRVLVVDDEPAIRMICRQAIVQRGLEVIEAAGGLEALKLIKEKEPDAILLDAMLPDVHGFDICKRIKQSKRYSTLPIVMMTAIYKGWRMAADLKESYGIFGLVEKPFDLGDLVRQVESAIAGQKDTGRQDSTILSAEARRHYNDGQAAYAAGDLESAVRFMSAAVAIDPLSATLRQQLGLLHAHRGADFAAIQELESAIELEPHRYTALRNLAILFQRHGFKRKACELWERAMSAAPDDATKKEIRDTLVSLL